LLKILPYTCALGPTGANLEPSLWNWSFVYTIKTNLLVAVWSHD